MTEITRQDTERLMAAGARVVDVLGRDEFTDSHLPGAVHLPLEQIGADAKRLLDPEQPTIVYCWDSKCDRSARAAWRLVGLGFAEVYDFVGSKAEWMGAGLPFEGTRAEQPHLATLADANVPTCGPDETTHAVAARTGDAALVVVVDAHGVVLGALTPAVLGGANAAVATVMEEGPQTFRPFKSAVEVARKLEKLPLPWVLVTTLDGKLVGVADPAAVRRAATADADAPR